MKRLLSRFGAAALRGLDPERAHDLAIRSFEMGLVPAQPIYPDPSLSVSCGPLIFSHPFGLAAGFDKNARAWRGLMSAGFSHVEVGTVTPKSQTGNPKPRIFRLEEDQAIINRLGFNNDGHEGVRARLGGRRSGILGVNIGANKESEDRIADYVAGVAKFSDVADYLTINISSPNTQGLRDLQHGDALDDLLSKCIEERNIYDASNAKKTPVFLKIAPDLDEDQIEAIADCVQKHQPDGVIISNTTLSRDGLRSPASLAEQQGGLSGAPLFERSTRVLAKMRKRLGDEAFLIAVGGVDAGEQAVTKICAGANLVQIYTGFVYHGPDLVRSAVDELRQKLWSQNVNSVDELVAQDIDDWL